MKIAPEISGASVVVIGSFNPAIFHPSWLFQNEVEPKVEDDLVNLEVCHRDISRFAINGTIYSIDQDRFHIGTNTAPWVQILDKTVLLFTDLLPHTPGRAFGINRDIHFRVDSTERRMEIGRRLAPIEPWGEFGTTMNAKKTQDSGGMLSLTMRSLEESAGFNITKNVKVEPSSQLTNENGIYMQVNFHFSPKDDATMSESIGFLQESFQDRINEAEDIFNTIMELA
jgi:hypothetical protein